MNKSNPCYLAIKEFYKDKRAKRSQVPLINHIDEGLIILDAIGTEESAKEAYCLHPIYQQTEKEPYEIVDETRLPEEAVALAYEYKRTANAYLSQHYFSEDDTINLSPYIEVNQMLIADKVQNRKDFEAYHKETHPNGQILDAYFKNWLRRLDISEDFYQELSSKI